MIIIFWIPSLVGLISVHFISPSLLPGLVECMVDFSLEFVYFFGGIILILLPSCVNCVWKVLAIFIDVLPIVIRIGYILSGWFYWLMSEIWQGLSGNIDKSTNILSWIIILCFILIYVGKILKGLQTLVEHVEEKGKGSSDNESNNRAVGHFSSTEEDQRLCVVCLDLDRDTAVFPCGHTHVCHDCITSVIRQTNKCPMCLGNIHEFRRVYV